MEDDRLLRIQKLNDLLRCQHLGGRVVITAGVQVLGLDDIDKLLKAIADFKAFSSHNDPWGEHDCSTITHNGQRYIWKIDYYDKTLSFHSTDSADPKVTERVLTVMRSDEY